MPGARDILRPAIAIVVFSLLLGLVYPLVMTGLAQVLFPKSADGSRVELDGRVVGSELIGQDFRRPVISPSGKPKLDEEGEPELEPDPAYFQSRPSVTGYSANVSYFNNLGPNNRELSEFMEEELQAYLKLERPYDPGLTAAEVPVDAVSTSASGVDPQISQANARIQAHRVAAVRGMPLQQVMGLISDNTEGRFLGLLGEPGVNVLKLNIALDKEAPR
ncbi:MAG TPA: potassium-transporting ATPase subunit C [Solirubrobacterales bacterium]|jgi:K+-transporting ATPase ATPase C chain